jgi:dolichol-phosphate mannosyltransferase
MTGPAKAVVVIPTYNERENIERLVGEIEKLRLGLDILFIDDNSPDGTGAFAEALARTHPAVRVMRRPDKEGLGRAYKAGLLEALEQGYEVILQMDADLSHDPAALPALLDKIGEYDAVFGSRYYRGVRVFNWSFKRLLLSKLSNEFIRIGLGIPSTDTTTAFKAFRRSVLEIVGVGRLKGKYNAFLIELVYLVVKGGFKTAEVPFTFRERESGESKMRLAVAVESLFTVLRLRLCASRNVRSIRRRRGSIARPSR